MSDRTALANAAAELMESARNHVQMTELEKRILPVTRDHPTMDIHWDDCDMDERKFWFHFGCPCLEREVAGSGMAALLSRAVRWCIKSCRELEDQSPYVWEWRRWESPRASYYSVGGRKEFDRYETTTWIYTLTFYGG